MLLLASMGTAHMHIAILNMYYTAHPGTADTAMHHTCVPTHKYNKQTQSPSIYMFMVIPALCSSKYFAFFSFL